MELSHTDNLRAQLAYWIGSASYARDVNDRWRKWRKRGSIIPATCSFCHERAAFFRRHQYAICAACLRTLDKKPDNILDARLDDPELLHFWWPEIPGARAGKPKPELFRLATAMLALAVQDLNNHRHRRDRDSALLWLTAEDDTSPTCARNIAAICGVPFDKVLATVREKVAQAAIDDARRVIAEKQRRPLKMLTLPRSVTMTEQERIVDAYIESHPVEWFPPEIKPVVRIIYVGAVSCLVCRRIIHEASGLTSHWRIHGPVETRTCGICGKECRSLAGYESHRGTHNRKACSRCGKTFSTQAMVAHSYHCAREEHYSRWRGGEVLRDG